MILNCWPGLCEMDITTAVEHRAFSRLDLQAKRALKQASDVNILESSGLSLPLNDESLWDLEKSAESKTLARVTATKWRHLYRNDRKELIAAVATLPGQPGSVPLGGMTCRVFLGPHCWRKKDTEGLRIAVGQAAAAAAHRGFTKLRRFNMITAQEGWQVDNPPGGWRPPAKVPTHLTRGKAPREVMQQAKCDKRPPNL